MSDGRATSPTYADVTRDVARTLEPPGNLYFSWMSVVALILTAGILAWAGQIWWGMGMAGKRVPQMWGMYIDRKSTRLNSSHLLISYGVFCFEKKKNKYKYL